jgi:predicted ferric reductase
MTRRAPSRRAADALAVAAGIGLGLTVAITVSGESLSALRAPGGALIAAGRLAGMVAAYAMILLVLLIARLPPVERVVGHARLVAWHRRVGPWPIVLVVAHGALVVAGYAQQARTGLARQLWELLTTYPGVLAGTVGAALLVAAGVTSWRVARRRMAYKTWWAVHLYTYLALFLAFSHQVATGESFVGHPLTRIWWTALWAGAAAVVFAYRVALPLLRSARHRLRVVAVQPEGPGTASVLIGGRRLDRLPVDGGQFVHLRILRRGLWWHAHPYSLSALPTGDGLRLTVRAVGDQSTALTQAPPGTRLAIEGPYGAFTGHARRADRVLLVGAGVGVAPVRALLEDLPDRVDVALVTRASTPADLVLRDELHELSRRRGAPLHELVGPRADVALDARALRRLVPDVAERDVYVCGPDGFSAVVSAAARECGVAPERIHHEAFAF